MLIFALLAACSEQDAHPGGTGVGNPGTTRLSMARSSSLEVEVAKVTLVAWTVDRCDGETGHVSVGATADLLAPEPFDLPGGTWCGLSVALDPPLHLEGAAEDGSPGKGTFAADLTLPEASVDLARLAVDGGSWVLELGSPTPATFGGLEDGTHTTVSPGDPLDAPLAGWIAGHAALWEDADGDGTIDRAERDGGPVGGDPGTDDDDDP